MREKQIQQLMEDICHEDEAFMVFMLDGNGFHLVTNVQQNQVKELMQLVMDEPTFPHQVFHA